jgi:hypothetical protein
MITCCKQTCTLQSREYSVLGLWRWYITIKNCGHYLLSCLLVKIKLKSIGLSVPQRKHIMSPLRAQQVNAIYKEFWILSIVLSFTFFTLFKTQLKPIGLTATHRKLVTFSLRAQPVHAVYRCLTMVYSYNCHNSGHYTLSCFYLELNSTL